jgi:hypothetical protein
MKFAAGKLTKCEFPNSGMFGGTPEAIEEAQKIVSEAATKLR